MKQLVKFLINTVPRPYLIWWSNFFSPILDIYFRGTKFIDPINGKSYRKFLPYGYVRQRENALSPGTLSLERHRLLWLFLKNETIFFKEEIKVLHIAPEQSFYNIFKKQKNLDYLTADMESPIADIHFDLHEIPLKENTFDVIFCNHVLEHVNDDHQCMKELYRVMKKGGWGIFQVPIDYNNKNTYEDASITDPKEREIHVWQKDHVRLYGLDYPERLKKAGFKITVFSPKDSLKEYDYEKLRLNPSELIYIVSK